MAKSTEIWVGETLYAFFEQAALHNQLFAVFSTLMQLFPETGNLLQGGKDKVRAAISIALVGGVLALLGILSFSPETPKELTIGIILSYVLIFGFILPAIGIFARMLEIEKSLFNDYASWPSWIHWTLIIMSLAALSILILIKYASLIFNTNHANTSNANTN